MPQVASKHSHPVNYRILDIRTSQVQAQLPQSEYQEAFKKWSWQAPRKAIRPLASSNKADGPVDLTTTTQAHYVPHKTQRVVKKAPVKTEMKKPSAKMPTTSTYINDFQGKMTSRPPACKPKERPTLTGLPFNAKSVYQETYIRWKQDEIDIHKVEVKIHQDNLGKAPNEVFEATTTVQDDFKRHENVSPATSMKPAETPHTSSQPFEDATTHRADFTIKSPSTRQAIKPRQQRTINTDTKFSDETTFQRDFPTHHGHKPESSYKPKREYFKSDGVFDGRTTQRTAYQRWPIPTREPTPWATKDRSAPLSYQHRAKLNMKTSYQDDFQDPGDIMSLDKCRGKPYRYYDSNLHNGGAGEGSQFDGSTNYTESYIAWKDVRPPKSYKEIEEYRPPIIPFMGESTSRRHYQGIYAPPAKSCKPSVRPQSSPVKGHDSKPITDTRPASCPVPAQ
ncbi:hypothetical protein BSL78_04418 [Apostichopus japonicus]|uniref:Stabilizer of axonemal microtubules 2 n=1 Tax=Stichopus japonicus TaxID=307972 RepID=A0A2G8LEE7_STIJA|nr:hypothetical protein BSL78_04418 [Apostichopus japonicus]